MVLGSLGHCLYRIGHPTALKPSCRLSFAQRRMQHQMQLLEGKVNNLEIRIRFYGTDPQHQEAEVANLRQAFGEDKVKCSAGLAHWDALSQALLRSVS
jgi:hypothetical protein